MSMILEELMLDLMYLLPDNKHVRDLEISREMAERHSLSQSLRDKVE